MSDDQTTGAAPGMTADNPEPASFRVLGQYVKDLSFENPLAPNFPNGQPQIDLSVDVQARKFDDTRFEVSLRVNCSAKQESNTLFLLELVYGGVFQLENIPAESLEPVLLIECPRFLYPFARRIVADLSRDGGFPPLMIDPIDFAALYRAQLEKRRQQQAEAGAGSEAPSVS